MPERKKSTQRRSGSPTKAERSSSQPSEEQQRAEAQAIAERDREGDLPKTGEEGGVVEEGTGDFAPETKLQAESSVDTVVVEDAYGKEIEVPVGADGENPVSPQNPLRKATVGGGGTLPAQENLSEEARHRNEGVSGDRRANLKDEAENK